MRALVTGATGFIGSHVAHALAEAGHDVRVLVRPTSDLALLEGVDAGAAGGDGAEAGPRAADRFDVRVGDVTDAASVRQAVKGCDAVFHLAGVVSFWRGHAERLRAVNVEGTRNVVKAAAGAGVARLVHTASVAALGAPPDGDAADETVAYNWDRYRIPYMETKRQGQEIVLGAARAGLLDAVVVNPGTVLGPGDKNKNGGQFVRAVAKGRMPGVPTGGVNVVDVRDVARGHLLAHAKGDAGERYILGGENLEYGALFRRIAAVAGVEPPTRRIPYPLAVLNGHWNDLVSRFTGRQPMLTADAARATYRRLYYRSDKARDHLGYDWRPVEESVRDTYDWYVEHGYL